MTRVRHRPVDGVDLSSPQGYNATMVGNLHSSFAVHPGEWLRAGIVEPAGPNVTELAERLRVTRQGNLLNGNSGLSAEMAIRFEKAFGVKADAMKRTQVVHELTQERGTPRKLGGDPRFSCYPRACARRNRQSPDPSN